MRAREQDRAGLPEWYTMRVVMTAVTVVLFKSHGPRNTSAASGSRAAVLWALSRAMAQNPQPGARLLAHRTEECARGHQRVAQVLGREVVRRDAPVPAMPG